MRKLSAWLIAGTLIMLGANTGHARIDYRHCVTTLALNASPEVLIESCTSFIKSNPDAHMRATALGNRGAAYVRLEQYDLALSDFDEALKIDYDNVQAYQNRGGAYLGMKDYQHAIQDFSQAIALNKRWAMAYKCRCEARAAWGQELDKAMEDCNTYMKLAPGPGAYAVRGILNLRLGQLADAIADFDASLDKEPKFTSSLYGRGIAELRSGKVAEGNADISAANALNAKVAKAFADIGIAP